MGMQDLFKRRPDVFIQRLVEQAFLTLQGMELLRAYIPGPGPSAVVPCFRHGLPRTLFAGRKGVDQRLSATEMGADEVRRILVDELLRTFVTPIDREDISALSRAIAVVPCFR